jgi:hypothetical protein
MSATFASHVSVPRLSDWYATRVRRRSALLVGAAALGSVGYMAAIIGSRTDPLLLAPLVVAAVVVAVMARPYLGVYMLFGAALVFEQTDVPGVAPLTDESHIWQRLDVYSSIPLPLSIADLLILLTLTGLIARHVARGGMRLRIGPLGWAVGLYGLAFLVGTVIGMARGGAWNQAAALVELRAPMHMCLAYFLSANLIRKGYQFAGLMWVFLALVFLKGVQGVWAFQDVPFALDAVTGHEDVVFFDLAIVIAIVMVMIRVRTRFSYALLAAIPLIVIVEVLTQRRVAFIALGAVCLAVTLFLLASHPWRAVALAGMGAVAVAVYVALFWDATGALAQPIRAVRAIVDPMAVSSRDLLSDHWRVVEIRNLEYTVRSLPLTGVGVGQEMLFREEPGRLVDPYWRYYTHNAVLWLWLKAGPLGAFALWYLVARTILLGAAFYRRVRRPQLRWLGVLPPALIIIQIAFSSIDMGLTQSRTMIVLGTIVGTTAALWRWRRTSSMRLSGTASG